MHSVECLRYIVYVGVTIVDAPRWRPLIGQHPAPPPRRFVTAVLPSPRKRGSAPVRRGSIRFPDAANDRRAATRQAGF
ncbi:hypothetical protein Q5P01_012069 [Channa striata]|uniref:Uncharacterized protein n=1 Tax=Channa striata TaxID=64152 RepID=A0AA88SQP4_CHASR|nr:hypothetical protein Q5P01_012069 [Channa striata]